MGIRGSGVLRGAQEVLRTGLPGVQIPSSHGLGYNMWCEITIMAGICANNPGENGWMHAGFMHIRVPRVP